ncbi:hypothetical protein J132_00187 [Termitomyces sp. J132]|nr:hypothetical protein J132_00187 [Termitomyces sp. J132]
MLDDDIEYIGTSLPSDDQIVTGLILQVDKSADDPSCTLTFRRAISNVVHIGRRPSNQGSIQLGKDSAMFRCAVVSRKHAKITFSDSGHVYLIDMNSHHGTHVRKPNEAVSRMLKPETPTKLSDGDIITLGKSVGRHDEYVRPIVAHAELIYGPREPTFKPVTPVKQITHVDLSDSPPSKSHSGRYGIYSQTSSSSGNISSSISEDSDVEEISSSISILASGPNALPLQPRTPRKLEPEPSHLGRAIEALKRFLPPAHDHSTTQIALPQIRPVVYTPSPGREQPLNLAFSIDDPYQPLCSPRSPDWPRSPRWSPPPVERNRLPSPFFDFSYCEATHLSRQDELRLKDPSRSHTPMDLASPSPLVPLHSLDADHSAQEEARIIGAWPASRSPSSQPSSPAPKESSLNMSEIPPKSSPPLMQKAMSLDSICSEPLPQNNESSVPTEELDAYEDSFSITANHNSDDLNYKDDSQIKTLQLSIKKLEDEVFKLQTYRHKYKARFNNNVHLISDKLSNLDERVFDVHAQYMLLVDRVDSAVGVDIPDLQAQLDVLREEIEAYTTHAPTNSDTPTEALHRRSDVEDSISVLHSLVADMRALHERTVEQMDTELRLVREARDAALAHIATHVEAQAQVRIPIDRRAERHFECPQNISLSSVFMSPSLKRKRSNGDADCAMGEHDNSITGDSGTSVGDAMTADTMVPSSVSASIALCCHRHSHDLPMPLSKRARNIAAVAAQTATAATVGAIATWSALAFS